MGRVRLKPFLYLPDYRSITRLVKIHKELTMFYNGIVCFGLSLVSSVLSTALLL